MRPSERSVLPVCLQDTSTVLGCHRPAGVTGPSAQHWQKGTNGLHRSVRFMKTPILVAFRAGRQSSWDNLEHVCNTEACSPRSDFYFYFIIIFFNPSEWFILLLKIVCFTGCSVIY